VRESYQKPE
jgi:hypothetical protein